MSKIVITVDGLAATGKGAISNRIADTLNIDCLDTGLLYRKFTYSYYTHYNGLKYGASILDNIDDIHEYLSTFNLEEETYSSYDLHSPVIGLYTSKLSIIPEIRNMINNYIIQSIECSKGIIVDGRDIGTYVYPQARYKIFVEVPLEEKVKRRLKQLQQSGDSSVTYSSILEKLALRDQQDVNRAIAPTKPAEDAIIITNYKKSIDQVVNEILAKLELS